MKLYKSEMGESYREAWGETGWGLIQKEKRKEKRTVISSDAVGDEED